MSRTPLARLSSRAHQHATTRMGSFTYMSVMSSALAATLIVEIGMRPVSAPAQEVRAVADAGTGAVAGVVTNTAGAGVRGVRVRVAGQERWVETSRDGSYHIDGVPAGQRVVQFLFTDDVGLAIPADVTSDAITGIEAVLPVVPRGALLFLPATGPAVVRYGPSAAIAAFVQRARHGGGYYFPRATLLERGQARVTDVIRGVPGLTLTDGTLALRDRFRGMSAGACDGVAIYLDGAPLSNEGSALSLLDSHPVAELAGIEVYTRPEQMPPLTPQSGRSCATVLIWTLRA